MNKPFKTYPGGKNASGVYQSIINQIPPHNIFISGFAGNCGVLANKKPATMANIAIDADASVTKAWSALPGIIAINADAITFLPQLIKCYPQQLTPHIFVFLDPPYLKSVRSGNKAYYNNELLSEASHIQMLSAVIDLPVNMLIIHYPCDLYNNMLSQWRRVDIMGQTRQGRRIERMYMNYPPPDTLHDYRFVGNNFRQREAFKKMKQNLIQKIERLPTIERKAIFQDIIEPL